MIHVPPGENLLGAALAAGLPLPHSCRGGRCGTCKSKLVAGRVEYPFATPGITPAEIAAGEVLLCQALPRSDLVVATRRAVARASQAGTGEIVELAPLALDAVRVTLRMIDGDLVARPGQFVEVRNSAGDHERLAVIGSRDAGFDLEAAADGSVLHAWLVAHAVPGARLRISGPFDSAR